MWPSWTTVHLAWQQTLFQHTSISIVMQQSCWMLPVVQEWCLKRYIHEITKKKKNILDTVIPEFLRINSKL